MALTRSQQMARIRGRDTTPERKLRSAAWKRGLRHRLNYKTPAGCPDLVYPGPRVAVFVDGCFWHGCPLHYVRPRTRPEFWSAKLAGNVDRDRRDTLKLEAAGWRVLRFLEHEIDLELETIVGQIAENVADPSAPPQRLVRVQEVVPVEARREAQCEQWTIIDLRQPGWRRIEHRKRRTTKWRVPRARGQAQ